MKQGHTSIIRASNTKTSCLAGSRGTSCAWLSLICFFKHSHKLTPRSSVLLDRPWLGQGNSLLYIPNRLGPVICLGDTDKRTCCGATLWQEDWWSLTFIVAVDIRLWYNHSLNHGNPVNMKRNCSSDSESQSKRKIHFTVVHLTTLPLT
jgi:hypothetical protein